jgi:hypothetical protein
MVLLWSGLLACGADGSDANPDSADTGLGADSGLGSGDVEDDADSGLGSGDVEVGTDSGAVEDTTDDDASDADPAVRFELGSLADDGSLTDWWAIPWPSDLRRDASGRIALGEWPNPNRLGLVRDLASIAADRDGYAMMPVAWFTFGEAPAPGDEATPIPAESGGTVELVVVDPRSPHRGEREPVVARVLERDIYTPDHVLAVAPVPGIVLRPRTTYAFVVRRSWGNASGAPLASSSVLNGLLAADAPVPPGTPAATWQRARGLYAPLRTLLAEESRPADEIAAATVFTTSDVVDDLRRISESVRASFDVEVTNLRPDAVDGDHATYCELHGTAVVPEFQTGTPPFNAGGLFAFDDAGTPIQQRQTEIPVVITVPKLPMPEAGYPVTLYFHGSGGLSTQAVDRGPDNTTGEGVALTLGSHGFATFGSALPVNPERIPGASDIAYINFANLKSFRDTFRQGVIEQRLLLDWLLRANLSIGSLEGCTGFAWPEGGVRFDAANVMATGQSMGGMYTNMFAPVEPRVRAVAPTGAGGYWSWFILQTQLIPGAANTLRGLLRSGPLSFLHPAMHLLELAWEPSEPMVYAARIARRPLEGATARSIYEPVGAADSYFPTPIFDAMALALGTVQAGTEVWPGTQRSLGLDDRAGLLTYPVSGNRALNGQPYTAAVVQWANDGVHDGHSISAWIPEVRYQLACFLASATGGRVPAVPAPAPFGSSCP